MKIWRCVFVAFPDGRHLSWHPSRAAAMAARKKLPPDLSGFTVEPVDIPTHKAGLIAWLNRNLDRDND